jgi:electron transfer flavoprotein beta subunit
MHVVVCIKAVLDNTKMTFNVATGQPEASGTIMSPYDEYALETALRLKTTLGETETPLTVLSLGGSAAKEVLKKAIAAGADTAFWLNDPALSHVDSVGTATALAAAIQKHVPDAAVVFCGQVALDTGAGVTGAMLAHQLGWSCLSYAKGVESVASDHLVVTQETEAGVAQQQVRLPGVVCTIKCDYELRSANIKGVMKANKTPIPELSVADLGLSPEALVPVANVTSISERPAKPAGQVVDGSDPNQAVDALVAYFKQIQLA